MLLFLASGSVNLWSAWAAFFTALPVAALSVGIPVLLASRDAGARHPLVEAVVWAGVLAVVAVVFVMANRPDSSPLNIVTTEDMQRRNEYYRTWHYPRELVWFVWCLVAYAVVAGTASVFIQDGIARTGKAVGLALAFGISITVSLVVALLLFVLALPVVLAFLGSPVGAIALIGDAVVPVCAFASGCVAGAGIATARRRFVNTESRRFDAG